MSLVYNETKKKTIELIDIGNGLMYIDPTNQKKNILVKLTDNSYYNIGTRKTETLVGLAKSGGGSQIEYLQSDGAIYIPLCESGETLNVKSFKIDIEILDNTKEQIFFGRYYNSYGSVTYNYGLVGVFIPNFSFCLYSGGYSPKESISDYYQIRKELNLSFSSQVAFDNNFGIFGGRWTSSSTDVTKYSFCKIWSCVCYDENGNEVANLLPKEENGILGMYDSVRQKFLVGVGSGSFIAG